jgi:hypothetical protein
VIWWWVDSGWACGGVGVRDGIIRAACPIFYRLIGQRLDTIPYRKIPL